MPIDGPSTPGLIDWANAARYGTPLALIVLDVDFFKLYNDHFGHPAGDECLRKLAAILRTGRRARDFPARIGGEEFCLLVPDMTLEGAHSVAEIIRASVQKLQLKHPKSPMGVVTLSIGVALAFPSGAMTAKELFRAADHALYEAKRSGRNRVHIGEEACFPTAPLKELEGLSEGRSSG